MNEAQQTRAIPCPRCGYDLSGVAERRRQEGQTTGRCSECGQEVNWYSLERADRHARRLAANREVNFIECGHDGLVRRFWLTSLRAMLPTALFPWITERQPINWSRLRWFSLGWLFIWAGSMVVTVSLSGLLGEIELADAVLWMLFMQAFLVVLSWALSSAGTWVFTRPRFIRPRQAPTADHLARVALYAVCGLMCAHSIVCVAQVVLLVVSRPLLALIGILHVFFYVTWIPVLGIAVLWATVWCTHAIQLYFAVKDSPVAWSLPAWTVLIVGLAMAGLILAL